MATTKIIPYTLQIHPEGEPDEDSLWNLRELQQYDTSVQSRIGRSDKPMDLTDIETFTDLFNAFCEYYETHLEDLGEDYDTFTNETFEVSSDWKREDPVVEGNLYLGNYGLVRNLVDRQSGERRERGRDVDDAEEKPLYFMAYTPTGDTKKAYLLVERSRRYGAKKPLSITLRRWIREHFSDQITVKVDPVKTQEIFPKMRDADRTVRLRLEKDGSPDQVHSRFNSVFDQDEMKQAVEYRPKDGEDMNLVVDELEAWYNDSGAVFETLDGTSYDNVKITIEKNDSEETISLTKGEAKLRKNIDLSDIAEEGDLPALTEISSRAHGFLNTVTGRDTGSASLFGD